MNSVSGCKSTMDANQTTVNKPQWELVSSQSLDDVVFCPSAIEDYANSFSSGKKPDHNLALLVRKRLLLLNWKIERTGDRKSYRYRYTSPNSGKVYLSLHLLCNDISNSPSVGFESVKILPRKRKIGDNDDEDDDVDYHEHEHEQGDDDESSDSVLSELTDLKSEDEEESCKALKVKRKKQRNFGPAVLSSLIDSNVVMDGEKVHYRATKSRNRRTEGIITRNGIECNCCRRIFALTQFEAHAGSTNHRPAANIILEDGRSLADCQRQLQGEPEIQRLNLPRKKPSYMVGKETKAKMLKLNTENKKRGRKEKVQNKERSDYLCSVCRQEGDLILCDDCPSAFHQICLGMRDVPVGRWSCPLCCCDHCGYRKFNDSFVRKDGYVLRCEQCPYKIHVGCAKDRGMNSDREKNPGWFCSDKCREICSKVQNLVGQSIVVGEDNLTWTLLRRKWPPKSSENNKLYLALEVMHECFDPVTEYYTGRDLVEDIIFSKTYQLPRVNFRRFFTILMEKNNEPIAVANLRIHGDKVAEVPLVATKFEYRRLGMCRKLMKELEKQLVQLGVEKLVLPSAPVTLQTWVDGFGFSEMGGVDRKQYFQHIFVDFQGTIMCQKKLAKI